MEDLFIVVGLGNPGKKYEETRHNIGFITIDELCFRHKVKLNKLKYKASFGEGFVGGKRVLFVKPQTFMNDSGVAVGELVKFFKIPLQNLIIVYDLSLIHI